MLGMFVEVFPDLKVVWGSSIMWQVPPIKCFLDCKFSRLQIAPIKCFLDCKFSRLQIALI